MAPRMLDTVFPAISFQAMTPPSTSPTTSALFCPRPLLNFCPLNTRPSCSRISRKYGTVERECARLECFLADPDRAGQERVESFRFHGVAPESLRLAGEEELAPREAFKVPRSKGGDFVELTDGPTSAVRARCGGVLNHAAR